MDAPQATLHELQTLKSEPASALLRLRELMDVVEQAMPPDRHSKANLAAALTRQAIEFICDGLEHRQNEPEINRRFALAIKRAEAWVVA